MFTFYVYYLNIEILRINTIMQIIVDKKKTYNVLIKIYLNDLRKLLINRIISMEKKK